jgi:hypothetical protein
MHMRGFFFPHFLIPHFPHLFFLASPTPRKYPRPRAPNRALGYAPTTQR